MRRNKKVPTADWAVDLRTEQKPFNDLNRPTVEKVKLLPGKMVHKGKIVDTLLVAAPEKRTLTLRLKLRRLRKSTEFIRASREGRYPVICDEVPNVVALIALKNNYCRVEYTLD